MTTLLLLTAPLLLAAALAATGRRHYVNRHLHRRVPPAGHRRGAAAGRPGSGRRPVPAGARHAGRPRAAA